jgi:uncharacterized membrane protein
MRVVVNRSGKTTRGTAMATAAVLLAVSLIGAAMSLYMTRKFYKLAGRASTARSADGGPPGDDRSVVQTPYARVFVLPNSLYGVAFYTGIAVLSLVRLVTGRWVIPEAATAAAVLAAVFSVYLAWSLIFRLKMPCPICFASHIINILIAALLLSEVF